MVEVLEDRMASGLHARSRSAKICVANVWLCFVWW